MPVAGRSYQGTTVISGAANSLNDTGRATLVDPPVLTTSGPIVVTTQNLTAFQRRQGWGLPSSDQNFGPTYRSTLQDPAVLTTAGPLVVTSPSSARFYRQMNWGQPASDQNIGPTYRNDLIDPPVPIIGFNPIVVSATRSARFLFEQFYFSQGVGIVTPDTRHPEHLSGTVTDLNALGGTITKINLGGSIVLVDPNLGGSATTLDVIDSTVDEWTMQEVDIGLAEFNDETLALAITSSGSPLNLTGLNLNMLLKPAAGVPDTDPGVVILSTVTGEIVITNAAAGLATASVANVDLTDPGVFTFYRVDRVDGAGKQNTALFGKVSITAL